MANCAMGRVTLSTDNDGRDWEHFWLGGQYMFSNQIPNRSSFTTTNPGTVISDRGLCFWETPTAPTNAAQAAPTMASGEGGAMGLLLLIGLVGSGVYAWFTKVKPDWSDDYHPMADAPPLPPAYHDRDSLTNAPPMPTQGDDAAPLPLGPSSAVIDRHRLSQATDDGASETPWDEPSSDVIDPSSDVIDLSSAVIDDTATAPHQASPYGLDKLKGVSLKQFKDQLTRQGITAESGSFKSVELLSNPGTALFIERRMMAFWMEFGSTRIPHAVYFVFGLQDGGNRSPEFKEQYEQAKAWAATWFKETLPQ